MTRWPVDYVKTNWPPFLGENIMNSISLFFWGLNLIKAKLNWAISFLMKRRDEIDVCCQSLLERLKISDFRRSRVNRRRVTDDYCYNCVYTWTASSGGLLFTSWILLPCAILTHFKKFSRVFFWVLFKCLKPQVVCECRREIVRLVWLTKRQQIPTGWIFSSVCACLLFVETGSFFKCCSCREPGGNGRSGGQNVSRLFLSFFLWIGCVCVCVCMSACVCNKAKKQMRNIVASAGLFICIEIARRSSSCSKF